MGAQVDTATGDHCRWQREALPEGVMWAQRGSMPHERVVFALKLEEGRLTFSYLCFFVVAVGTVCAATCDRCMGEIGSSGGMMPVWYHTPEGGVLPACVMRREV